MRKRIARLIAVGLTSVCLHASLPVRASGGVGDYRAGVGDTLNVVVYGEDKLSGRFRVSPAGTISYPLLGEIAVADLSTLEIGRNLAAALAERIPSSGIPSVEVVEYAPVFVLGNVDKPGPYQYRPGMTVLELVALAGGEKRAGGGETVMLQIISTEQELVDLRIARWSEMIRKTRIRAEIAGQDFNGQDFNGKDFNGKDFDGKDAIAGGELVAPSIRQQAIDNEVSLFRVRRTILAEQNKALAAQRASYDQEIASLEEGIKLHDEELRLLEEEVRTQQSLYDKGLAVQPRLLAVKRELSATRRNALELRSYLARARQRQLEVDQKIGELRDQWMRDNATMLTELDISIARRDERIGSLVAMLGELRERATSVRSEERRTTNYTVTRQEQGRYVTRPVGELDAIAPRDILRIDLAGPARFSEGAGLSPVPTRDVAAR